MHPPLFSSELAVCKGGALLISISGCLSTGLSVSCAPVIGAQQVIVEGLTYGLSSQGSMEFY